MYGEFDLDDPYPDLEKGEDYAGQDDYEGGSSSDEEAARKRRRIEGREFDKELGHVYPEDEEEEDDDEENED
ncbi:unnamed protein product [Dovyalis caffra]|uniref:Uncharacterized protein n=1 Tax=Dovyalis caffra TaxID=77055 RepID=A0AAV1S4G6_9ROSI|nr:unnamed protein product [Dovyalis caffra]